MVAVASVLPGQRRGGGWGKWPCTRDASLRDAAATLFTLEYTPPTQRTEIGVRRLREQWERRRWYWRSVLGGYHPQRLGRREDWNSLMCFEVEQMPIAGDDDIDLRRDCASEHLIVVGVIGYDTSPPKIEWMSDSTLRISVNHVSEITKQLAAAQGVAISYAIEKIDYPRKD